MTLPGYDDWLTRDDPANMPDDDDAPNADDIEDELLANPAEIVSALFFCADEDTVVDVRDLTRPATFDPDAMTPGQLLAVVLNGFEPGHVKAAAYALRQHVIKTQRQRAEEIYMERLRQHVGAGDCYAFED